MRRSSLTATRSFQDPLQKNANPARMGYCLDSHASNSACKERGLKDGHESFRDLSQQLYDDHLRWYLQRLRL